VLHAAYDINKAPRSNHFLDTLVQVDDHAVVACVATDSGRELSIVALSRDPAQPNALQLGISAESKANSKLFVPMEDYGTDFYNGCS